MSTGRGCTDRGERAPRRSNTNRDTRGTITCRARFPRDPPSKVATANSAGVDTDRALPVAVPGPEELRDMAAIHSKYLCSTS